MTSKGYLVIKCSSFRAEYIRRTDSMSFFVAQIEEERKFELFVCIVSETKTRKIFTSFQAHAS